MALISGCGGGGSGSGSANIRLINASAGYSSLDLTVNSNKVGTAAYGAATDYSVQDVNATTATLTSNGTTVLAPSLSTVICGSRCSLIAFGWSGAISRVILQENQPQPAAGYAALNLQNLSPDAGALDIYVTPAGSPLSSPIAANVQGGNGSGFLPINVGASGSTYSVTITGYNKPADVRLTIPSITIPPLQVATLITTATPGGVLVNGILAVQGGGSDPNAGKVTAYSGTNARVRVVGALIGNPVVSASMAAGKIDLLDPQVTLAIGDYQTVPATATGATDTVTMLISPFSSTGDTSGATPLNIPYTFVAGHDYTVLVSGTLSAPVSKVIDDDNRLPVVGTAKIRLTNGMVNTSAAAGLTLKLDSSRLAANVVSPSTSDAAVVSVTNLTQTITVSSPLSSVPLFTSLPVTLQSGGVYEVFMSGDATVPNNSANANNPNVVQGQLSQLR